jgi:hypothetical protein
VVTVAKELIHEGRIGWWSGKGYALCGAVITKAEYKDSFFGLFGPSVNCPGCKAAKKGR